MNILFNRIYYTKVAIQFELSSYLSLYRSSQQFMLHENIYNTVVDHLRYCINIRYTITNEISNIHKNIFSFHIY